MTQWLKQSTAATGHIGPFVASGDGYTPQTSLTIERANVRLSKNGGDMAQKNQSTSCTHDEVGMYFCPLDTTDTNTLGRLKLVTSGVAAALPVWHDFMVVPAAVYDALFGTSALDVNVSGIAGAVPSAAILASVVDDTTRIDASKLNTLSGHDPAATLAKAGDAMILTAAYEAAKTAAGVGAAMTLTSAYDAAKTAATQTSVDAVPTTGEIKTALEIAGGSLAQILTNANELQANQTGWVTATGFSTSGDIPTTGAIRDCVWQAPTTGYVGNGTFGRLLNLIRKLRHNKSVDSTTEVAYYDDDDSPLGVESWTDETGTRGKNTVTW
jgi:hypothetical protein